MTVPFYVDESVTVYGGDCIDVLRELDADSVDAVVTDPPYGLEFMGQDWDKPWAVGRSDTGYTDGGVRLERPQFGDNRNPTCTVCGGRARGARRCTCQEPSWRGPDPGNAMRLFGQWCEAWAVECLRVLKPGGHLVSFGGTRTWHRLACAVEDAGFEIRDSIAWLYGCHDDETEALTARGWVRGLDLTEDDELAQWSDDGTVEFVRPSALHRYPYEGQLVRFRNADVDQAVTPNHRVVRQVSERTMTAGVRTAAWSPWRVDEAADVNRWQPMRVPAGGDHDGPGIGGTDYAALLGWVWAEGGFDRNGTGVRVYQSSVNADRVEEIAALLDRLGAHKRYDRDRQWRDRAYVETCWFMSGELANRVRADLPGKHPTWDLLLRMTAAEKRALWDAAMKGDGSRDQRVFWQKDRADLEWAQALLALTSRRGVLSAKSSLCWTERPTVELQARHLRDESMPYAGDVWCATVPSGAFVIRRNGRVSVSGNSGFPKSLDVSKAIDKAAGATREKVADSPYAARRTAGDFGIVNDDGWTPSEQGITAPATDDARTWQGWGTALKPAFEPIVVARKPLTGTVAGNVLAYGTGAINVDGTRVAMTPADRAETEGKNRHGEFESGPRKLGDTYVGAPAADRATYDGAAGRWPTNVVLDEDAAAELDRQSGTLTSGDLRPYTATAGDRVLAHGLDAKDREKDYTRSGDSGGASRFFPTFRYEAKAPSHERPGTTDVDGVRVAHPTVKPLDLMRWLVRLVTPPGGTVLDPFLGSGTTAEACVVEGMRCVGVERHVPYHALIRARLTKPIETVLW